MADYWKSQPRKFCQYCKCWIADNKPSIEFHERGKNHKENVAAKISEIKKKSLDKAKQEQRMSKEFAAMEEAAQKAYEEDLKRMERESAGLEALPQKPASTRQPQPLVITQKTQPKPQAKPQAKKQFKKAKRTFTDKPQAPIWVEGQTDDGNIYYYNTKTGESQWEKPGESQGQSSAAAQLEQTESSSVCPWMEAVSPDGYTYYYNSETGESSWEKPDGFLSSEAAESEPNKEEESQGEEEESSSQADLPAEVEENSDSVAASQEAPVPEEASQPSKIPKISFRKRKAEAEPSETEGEDKVSEDAPREEAEETTKEVPSTTAEPVEEKKQEATPRQAQAKRTKNVNPYGAWEQIQEEEDPFADVDLQLPQVEGSEAVTPADLPPEPKPKFKERIITSLGEEGGPASFRKKGQNGKSRNLRQRDNDD